MSENSNIHRFDLYHKIFPVTKQNFAVSESIRSKMIHWA
jgi:hypothetical protein